MADLLCRPETAPPDVEREQPVYEVTDTGNSSMKVVVRVRPESEAELRSSCQCVVKVMDEHVLLFDPATNSSTAPSKDETSKKFAPFSSPGEAGGHLVCTVPSCKWIWCIQFLMICLFIC